jgi:hypothetical protein
MTKTITNVTSVVNLLITSCQVSEKPNTGPVTSHTTTTANAPTMATLDPSAEVTADTTRADVGGRTCSPVDVRCIT